MDTKLQLTISTLTDLQLALLICLIAEQQPIIRAPAHLLDEVQAELEDAARYVFGLTCGVVNCDENMGVEEFAEAVVGENEDDWRVEGRGSEGREVCVSRVCMCCHSLVKVNVIEEQKNPNKGPYAKRTCYTILLTI